MRWLTLIAAVLLAALAGLAGYAYLGDMEADPQEMRLPVPLDPGAAVTKDAQN